MESNKPRIIKHNKDIRKNRQEWVEHEKTCPTIETSTNRLYVSVTPKSTNTPQQSIDTTIQNTETTETQQLSLPLNS